MKPHIAALTLAMLPVLAIPALGVSGYWITGVQGDPALESRPVHTGDILNERQLDSLTGNAGAVTYRQIKDGWPEEELTAAFCFGSRDNKPPIAEDSARETYKNLEVSGHLKVRDPEGLALTYTVTRQPRRGLVTIHEDGSFTYTPKKNKVGVDSFAYTAADPAGNVSREATVTLTIIQPTEDARYTDTDGESCCFAAQWMKNTGIFVGESVDGNAIFSPNRSVSQGQLVAMVVKTFDLPTSPDEDAAWCSGLPGWLKPYVAAAMRSGLLPNTAEGFRADADATGIQACAMVCNALGLRSAEALGLEVRLTGNPLTRAEAAELLYAAHRQYEGGKVRILGN